MFPAHIEESFMVVVCSNRRNLMQKKLNWGNDATKVARKCGYGKAFFFNGAAKTFQEDEESPLESEEDGYVRYK